MSLKAIQFSEPTGGINSTMQVVVRADKRDELEGSAAKEIAKKFAASKGVNARGFSDVPMTLPVNANDETTEDVAIGKEPVAGYVTIFKFSCG